MEGLIFDLPLKETNLTVYSDFHLDAESCSIRMLKAHMERRASLPNPLFVMIGDVGNWIMTRDEKRFMPGVPLRELAARDDYVNAAVKYHYEVLKGYPWLFLGIGNHELTMLKYHSIDVGAMLAEQLAVPCGWYSGFARLRFHCDDHEANASSRFTLLYHHGFSVGQATKGTPAAVVRWAAGHEGWDVCCYGHNHKMGVEPDVMVRMTERGKISHRDRFYVNTGTFQRNERQGGPPDYAEVRGFPPTVLGAPLIRLRPVSSGAVCPYSIEVGDC